MTPATSPASWSRKDAPASASVSVVVPCLNEREFIGGLLEALQQQDSAPDEVIVVDGGSTDGTLDVLRLHQRSCDQFPIHVVALSQPSIPQALNAGIAAANGNIVVRLDAHSKPGRCYISAALPHFPNADIGVVGGPWDVVGRTGSAVAAGIARAVSHPLGAGDAAYRTGHHHGMPVDADTVPFGCFRKDVWRTLGGFDESLHSNEDYEFNYRVRKSGLRVVLDPSMRSVYYARPTLRALAHQYFRYGWWKAQMLRRSPRSLRWRQAVPAAFVTLVVMLGIGGFAVPGFWFLLRGVLAVYAAALLGVSTWICAREGGWRRWPALGCAFCVVHFCWGGGFLVNLITRAKWPRPAVTPTATSSHQSQSVA